MLASKVKLFAALAAVTALSLAPACKKEGGGGATSKEAQEALGYMPASAAVVMGINISAAANSKVLSKYKDKMLAEAPAEFQEFQKACGINVMTDIKSVMIGMVEKEKMVFVINGSFTQAKVEDCMKKVAEKEGDQITMSDDGKVRVYKSSKDPEDSVYAFWPSDGTVVLTGEEIGGKDLINMVANGSKLGDGPVMSLVKSTKTSSTFWAAGDPSKIAPDELNEQGITGLAMTVDTGDNLDIKVLVNFQSEAKASELKTMAEAGLMMAKGHPMAAQFKDIMDKIKIEADGKAIKGGISLSDADLDKIEKAAKSMGGMF